MKIKTKEKTIDNLKIKCDECDDGKWFDGSHACNRICQKCRGTGFINKPINKPINNENKARS